MTPVGLLSLLPLRSLFNCFNYDPASPFLPHNPLCSCCLWVIISGWCLWHGQVKCLALHTTLVGTAWGTVDLSESWLRILCSEISTGIPEQDAFNPEKWTPLKIQSVIAAAGTFCTMYLESLLFTVTKRHYSLHMDAVSIWSIWIIKIINKLLDYKNNCQLLFSSSNRILLFFLKIKIDLRWTVAF